MHACAPKHTKPLKIVGCQNAGLTASTSVYIYMHILLCAFLDSHLNSQRKGIRIYKCTHAHRHAMHNMLTYIHMYMHTHMRTYMCTLLSMDINVHMCVYIYIYRCDCFFGVCGWVFFKAEC